MAKIKFLCTHCSDTSHTMEVTPDDITLWHKGMLRKNDGTFEYMGKKYTAATIQALNNEFLTLPSGKKIDVLKTNGRGWSRVGYADLIQRSGKLINLSPYDFDDNIEPLEVTNGAVGYNANTRHVVLVGGWTKDGKKEGAFQPEELFTPEQIDTYKSYIAMQREMIPTLHIIGHNEVAPKSCPNFLVQPWLVKQNIPNP